MKDKGQATPGCLRALGLRHPLPLRGRILPRSLHFAARRAKRRRRR